MIDNHSIKISSKSAGLFLLIFYRSRAPGAGAHAGTQKKYPITIVDKNPMELFCISQIINTDQTDALFLKLSINIIYSYNDDFGL